MNWYQQAKQADIDWRALGKGTGIGAGLGLGLLTLLNNPDGPIQQMPAVQNEPVQRSPEPTEEATEIQEKEKDPDIFVARVIFSEAANVSDEEREMVASVIKNRIDHPGFDLGKLDNMNEVVNQRNAFEAIGDSDNMNWDRSERPEAMRGAERHAWEHSLSLSSGDFKPVSGPSGRPLVYYHDKSIGMPGSWTNKYWRAIKEIETEHFIFYSVVPAEGR